MKLFNNKFIQFSTEAFLIAILGYFAHQLIPTLPWWTIAVIAGIIAFALDTDVKSFATGFTAVVLLWGFIAYQINGLNAEILASRVAEMLSGSEIIAKIGGLNPTRLIYLTAILGGIVGGLGAMTGALGRRMWVEKEVES